MEGHNPRSGSRFLLEKKMIELEIQYNNKGKKSSCFLIYRDYAEAVYDYQRLKIALHSCNCQKSKYFFNNYIHSDILLDIKSHQCGLRSTQSSCTTEVSESVYDEESEEDEESEDEEEEEEEESEQWYKFVNQLDENESEDSDYVPDDDQSDEGTSEDLSQTKDQDEEDEEDEDDDGSDLKDFIVNDDYEDEVEDDDDAENEDKLKNILEIAKSSHFTLRKLYLKIK